MALKVELKAGERLVLGGCLLINEGARTRLCIEGDVPVLREKDIMTAERADTPAKRLYLAVQTLYLSRDRGRFDIDYAHARQQLGAGAALLASLGVIDACLEAGHFYKALKEAGRLVSLTDPLMPLVGRQPVAASFV